MKWVLAFATLALFGCGKLSLTSGDQGGGLKDFLYSANTPTNTSPHYQYATNIAKGMDTPIASMGNKKMQFAKMELYLTSDQSYTMVYREYVSCRRGTADGGITTGFRVYRGAWSSGSDSSVFLSNLGQGSVVKQPNGAELDLQTALPQLNNRTVPFFSASSSLSKENNVLNSNVTPLPSALQMLDGQPECY